MLHSTEPIARQLATIHPRCQQILQHVTIPRQHTCRTEYTAHATHLVSCQTPSSASFPQSTYVWHTLHSSAQHLPSRHRHKHTLSGNTGAAACRRTCLLRAAAKHTPHVKPHNTCTLHVHMHTRAFAEKHPSLLNILLLLYNRCTSRPCQWAATIVRLSILHCSLSTQVLSQ